MAALLLHLLLLIQGVPSVPGQTGTIAGLLRTTAGMPAVKVRVVAMAQPEKPADIALVTAFAGITETDAEGRYRLANIPPGRYYIAAGRVDYPTYYPGTVNLTSGTIVVIGPGATITNIDFVLNDATERGVVVSSAVIPVRVRVDGTGKIPIYAPGGFTAVRVTPANSAASAQFPLMDPSISVQPARTPTQFRISVENLPAGYAVKSIAYGAVDLVNGALQLPAATETSTMTSGTSIFSILVTFSSQSRIFSIPSVETLFITLSATPQGSTAGVHVTGTMPGVAPRSVYLSGVPGNVYSDGGFEFSNVPPGRHTIATLDNPGSYRPLAASIVVGNRDIEGIALADTALLPVDIQKPTAPGPAGNHPPGLVVSLPSINGQVLDSATREPIPSGTVFLTGVYGTSTPITSDGRFHFPRLLPGDYKMEVNAFGYQPIRRLVTLGDDDVDLELTPQP